MHAEKAHPKQNLSFWQIKSHDQKKLFQAYPQSNVSSYSPSYAHNQYHPQQQPQQQPPQPAYQQQQPTNQSYHQTPSNYQNYQNYGQQQNYPAPRQQQLQQQYQPQQQQYTNPDPTYMRQSTPSYLPPPPTNPVNKASCTTAFAGGLAVGNKPFNRPQYSNQQPAQVYSNKSPSPSPRYLQQPPNPVQSPEPVPGRWGPVKAATPVHSGYVQPQYNQRESYPNPSSANVNQYQQQVQSIFIGAFNERSRCQLNPN